VHDILDYTILNKEDKNFVKNFALFDIRDAMNELKDILNDKIILKDIQVEIHFVQFNQEEHFIIKTDQKRL